MSDTINMACKDCGEYLWFGQMPYKEHWRLCVYTADGAIAVMNDFLSKHICHDIRILNDEDMERMDNSDEGWRDFEGDD